MCGNVRRISVIAFYEKVALIWVNHGEWKTWSTDDKGIGNMVCSELIGLQINGKRLSN